LVASYDVWPGNGAGLFWKVRDRYGKEKRKRRRNQFVVAVHAEIRSVEMS